MVKGDVSLNGTALRDGDGVSVSEETELSFTGMQPAGGEILFFDLQ